MRIIMNHKGTKTIETKRLILRAFKIEDAELMFRNWASDTEVTKFLSWATHENTDITKQVIQSWIDENSNCKSYQWAIELKEIHEPIGSISAMKIDDRTKSATIGYCIGRNWWNQGIMTEALQAVTAFFFDEVDMNCINACHDPRNPSSGKVMIKCGMTYEGTWRAGGINNQGICDESWYSILKEEYQKKLESDEYQKKSEPDEYQRKPEPGKYQKKPEPNEISDTRIEIWDRLYEKALAVQNDRKISDYVDAGGVAAAILTEKGNIYTGVCVDTCSTLGICAERNAIFNMLTNGEHKIKKVLAIMPNGRTGAPCGACRELIIQLMPDTYKDIKIMLDYSQKRIVTLDSLTPEWWI